MSVRAVRWAASAVLVTAVGCAVAAALLGVLQGGSYFADWGLLSVTFLAFAAVGWVVATRRPDNPVGWLLLFSGGLPLVVSFVQTYAELALTARPGSPSGALLAWLGELPWLGIWGVFGLLLLLFPTGRPASGRWRWIVRAAAANALAGTLVGAVAYWPLRTDLVGPQPAEPDGVWGLLLALSAVGVAASILAGVVSLAVRYRAGGEEQRAQLRWVAYAGVLVVGTVTVVVARQLTGAAPALLDSAAVVGVASVPVAMGAAILRYRLYDVDRIASRTATYALLTGVLAATYVAAVLLFGRLLALLGAGGDLAVAAATLSAAALFAPARRRIQRLVDRRFNRARYDAERIIAGFRERLRDEVDLDEIVAALEAATARTVQPATTACWLRDARAP